MKLNHQQLAVLWLGLGVAALAVLMPPWTETFHADGVYSERPLGHAPLFALPTPEVDAVVYGVSLDLGSRLAVAFAYLAKGRATEVRRRPFRLC